MSLTNRLTLFFLVALGLVLAAFSGTMYVLARTYLLRELNDRATATLDTLIASAEVEDDGLEWEPRNRQIILRGYGEPPIWAVYDEIGKRLDGTDSSGHPLEPITSAHLDADQSRVNVTWEGAHWRILRRVLRHPHPEAVKSTNARPRYRALVFETTWPVAPIYGLLRTLAWSLGGVSAALWGVASLGGRWVCRRAIAPVTRMTETAKRITADDLGERLPVPAARDELHDLADKFNALLGRLQDSFERQRRFTGEASHQLRTPLTAMLGQMEVALRRDRDPGEYRRVLTTAVTQAGRLHQIVESLLFLARADADAQLPGLEPIELAGWLSTHIVDVWSGHARYADLKLETPNAVIKQILAQPTLLGQAVDNLIDNAFKYSESGSPVHVQLNDVPGAALIVIRDEGQGIASTDFKQVFTPFFRTDSARQRGVAGLGLGLALADRIVHAFGGRIVLESGTGKGCKFIVLLPVSASVTAVN
ncbi:hypothetical protein BH10PLA2_BH10PLA2_23930 [soil metagenome]